MAEIALYQPDIPQNTGTILRMAACLGLKTHIIEPTGFLWSISSLRRSGMDYLDSAKIRRHPSFEDFLAEMTDHRIILATTKGACEYTSFNFLPGDILLFGRESAGVPDDVHAAADERIFIPMHNNMRSLNIAVSAAMITGEAIRQLKHASQG